MSFTEGVNEAGDNARRALDLMKLHNVPAVPPNFAVWYNYVSDRFPDLKKRVDELVEGKQPFDDQQNEKIYDAFIGHLQQSVLLQSAGEEMQDQVQKLLQALGVASNEMAGFSSSIKDNLDNFSQDKSLGGVEAFIQTMMLETRHIQKTNAQLQEQLNESSEKISALQESLKQAEEEAYKDSLTSIANRKKFDVTIVAEMKAADEQQMPLCLVVGDIDHFKSFNDKYGHQVGDQVLKLVAKALHENVKGSDLAARYGGEEFALILPRTKLEDAFGLVETIREAIGSKRITNMQKGADYGSVTLSLGLTQYQPGETASEFIGRADGLLYKAKNSGRNRTERAA